MTDWLVPDWPAPAQVRAASTTRAGGVSRAPYDSMNVSDYVGDAPEAVRANRARLRTQLNLPSEPRWLKQVHGTRVLEWNARSELIAPEADASIALHPGIVCAVQTADCLPVLLCDAAGTRVAAVHAGWRGLAAGVIEATVERLRPCGELFAWLGPAIGPHAFEVGDEVRVEFIRHDARAIQAFSAARVGHWWADIYALARLRLQQIGVTRIYGGQWCTVTEAERFFSYRRDKTTGRMANLIWIEEAAG